MSATSASVHFEVDRSERVFCIVPLASPMIHRGLPIPARSHFRSRSALSWLVRRHSRRKLQVELLGKLQESRLPVDLRAAFGGARLRSPSLT